MASAESSRSVLSSVTADILEMPSRPSPSRSSSSGALGPSMSSSTSSMASVSSAATATGGSLSRLPVPSASTAASHLTHEAALAGAGGDMGAALDAVLAERNMLSSQNAQLWKLIEKQRASYANAVKDLERIRGERDKALTKLDRDRKHHHSHRHRDRDTTTPGTPQKHSQPIADSAAADAAINGGSGGSESARSSPQQPDNDPHPPPHESPPPTLVQSPPTIVTSLPLAHAQSPSSRQHHSASADTPNDGTRPLQIGKKQHSLDSNRSSPTAAPPPPPVGPAPVPVPSLSASNMLMPTDHSKRSKRESRVSLPPEARAFMQAVDDGIALPSPGLILMQHQQQQHQQQQHQHQHQHAQVNGVHRNDSQAVLTSVTEDPVVAPRPVPSPGTPPFLDMKDEDDADLVVVGDSDNDDDDDDDDEAGPSAPVQAQAPMSFAMQQQYPAPRLVTASTEDPELEHTPRSIDDSTARENQSLQAPLRQPIYDLSSTPPNTPPGHPQQQQPNNAASAAAAAAALAASKAGTFRAQRITHPDLVGTSTSIAGSHIRPNDRGKEVLSFIIAVQPPRGAPPYKIEKLYSDVVALDARVRSLMSKSAVKNLAALPDTKLFKDNAPAKVDQRKLALEKYLVALVQTSAKLRSSDDLCAFLSSDIMRDSKAPVMQTGHKEGYLTKRGKNFGGWKTRYFVLQNATLEYYESRGGTHLGSIVINGAQIGRQQRPQGRGASTDNDDDNEFRHAFLIIEAKRGPGGQSPRHVLCAESDADRDAWVDVLVRYVTGEYSDATSSVAAATQSTSSLASVSSSGTAGRPSYENTSVKRPPRMSKDEISVSKVSAVPISQLQVDAHNAKLFQSAPIPMAVDTSRQGVGGSTNSPVGSPDRGSPAHGSNSDPSARRIVDGPGSGPQRQGHALHPHDGQHPQISLSTSVPSYLDVAGHSHPSQQRISPASGTPRSASEMGHYPDLKGPPVSVAPGPSDRSSGQSRQRASYHPSLSPANEAPERPYEVQRSNSAESPDLLTPRAEQSQTSTPVRSKISGPMNGTPIPAGYNFGGGNAAGSSTATSTLPPGGPAPSASSNSLGLAVPADKDRRGKGVSRFWGGFSRDKAPVANAPNAVPRAVIGVALDESLAVAQIATLPAIVFRCIQYLEAKRADQEEGIYRLSGSSAVVKQLRERFNAEGDVDLLACDEFWDPHAIAGLLKSFLRELPASILTRELHLQFLHVIDFAEPADRISELQSLIAKLPLANYSLLRALTAHLILIVQNSGVNKMPMRNVGIVFSPTLGIPAGVFSLMLGEFNRVFSVDQGQQAANNDEDPNTPVDPTAAAAHLARRNSRHYADTSADQMLGLSGRSLPTNGDDSDEGEAEEMSVHDESGTETENEADATMMVDGNDAPSVQSHSQHSQHSHPQHPQHPQHAHSQHAHGGYHQQQQQQQQQQQFAYQQQQQYQNQQQHQHPQHGHHHQQHYATAPKAASTAAARGLQVNVPDGSRRTSAMPGLPTSPRPMARTNSGPQTPTLATTQR